MIKIKLLGSNEKLVGGLGDNKPDSVFDPDQLEVGIEDETGEHTPDPQIGKEIAKDHLSSDPDYYKKLKAAGIEEGWSDKYKKSIDCNNPKGFSQRAHCQGRKKMSEELNEGKYRPSNPSLWSRAKAAARAKFAVYPSAYANLWASKWYKKHGGSWAKKGKKKGKKRMKESLEIPEVLLCECSCGCDQCMGGGEEQYYDDYEGYPEQDDMMDDEINMRKGEPDLNGDEVYSPEELYYHFDLDNNGEVTPDEYKDHVEFHAKHPELLTHYKKQVRPVVYAILEDTLTEIQEQQEQNPQTDLRTLINQVLKNRGINEKFLQVLLTILPPMLKTTPTELVNAAIKNPQAINRELSGQIRTSSAQDYASQKSNVATQVASTNLGQKVN